MIKRFYTLLSMTLFCTVVSFSLSAQNFTCNDQINVTVNTNCAIDLTVDALIEGDTDVDEDIEDGLYTYEIYTSQGVIVTGDVNGPITGGDDMSAYVNTFIFYRVLYTGSNNVCGGIIKLEDKNDPTIDCEICPVVNGNSADDYAPECVLSCYDQPILQLRYDNGLRDDLVQEDYEDFADDAMTDNCNNWDLNAVSHYDSWNTLGVCEGTVLKRTWTVGWTKADGTLGTVSCTREYFFKPFDLSTAREYDIDAFGNTIIEPILDSIIFPVSDIEIPCGSDVSPAAVAAYFDNPTTVDRDSDDNNIDPDELDVDLVVENNEGIPYGYPHYYQEGVGSGGPHAQALSYDICNIITNYTDTEVEVCGFGCNGNLKILRNWTILDWCSSVFIEYGQLIKAVDIVPPTIDVNEVTVSVDPWNCEADVNLPFPEHLFDDCDPNPTYRIGNSSGFNVAGNATDGYILVGASSGTHVVQYITEDCCGNIGRTNVNVTVVDNTPPVAVSKEFIVTSLVNINNPVDQFQGTAKVYAMDLDNGSYDGCTDITIEIRRDGTCRLSDTEWGPFVTFCCEDLQGVASRDIDVEIRILDEYGNENRVWSTVKLEDKSGTFPVIPPHMFLTCDMDYNNFEMTGGLPKFFGACGEATVECDTTEVIENTQPRELRLSDGVVINGIPQVAPAYDPSCGFGAVRRQFVDCGGGEQWFVIQPLNPFDDNTINFPEDLVIDCDNYTSGDPSWLEATCNLIGVSVDSDTFMFEDGACSKILNHWSVINWCQYDPSIPNSPGRYDYTQVIKLIDTQDPVLTVQDSICFAVVEECSSKGVVLSASAVDEGNCGSAWISWEVSIDANADWTEDFNYSSTNPRLLPNGDPNPFYLPKTANGEMTNVVLPDGIQGSKIWHRAVWRAFDGCGNTVSSTRYFQIADKKAPTPYCLNLSTAVMANGQVELWAIDFNVGSFDNCTNSNNLLFTFTDVAPPARKDEEYDSNDDLMWYNGTYWYYNSEELDLTTGAGEYEKQDNYGDEVHRWEPALRSAGKIFTAADVDQSGMLEVPIYVWDECANIDFCIVNLRIIDNGGGGQAMVSGNITTEFGEAVENVVTNIKGPVNYAESKLTDDNGVYAFVDAPIYADYAVSATKDDDYINGVSTLDLVLMQRHILGQAFLDSPYKMIAADINNDNKITAVDLLELRKLILGIYDELPNNNSWKFIDSDDQLTVDAAWNYNLQVIIDYLEQDMMSENFVGVKIGDVNGSVVANLKSAVLDSRASKTIALSYTDRLVRKGEVFDIEFTADASDLYGYQFALNLPGVEILEVSGQELNNSNVAFNNHAVSISANNNTPFALGQSLITLSVRSNVQGNLSDIMNINMEMLKPEAYAGSELEIVNVSLINQVDQTTFALYQNEPNPFKDYTTIAFDLPSNMYGTLSVYDVTGRILKLVPGNFVEGRNTVLLSRDDFGSAGMVYYKLEAGEFSAVRHMVIIE